MLSDVNPFIRPKLSVLLTDLLDFAFGVIIRGKRIDHVKLGSFQIPSHSSTSGRFWYETTRQVTVSPFVWMFLQDQNDTQATLLLLLTRTSSETLAKLFRMARSPTSTTSWTFVFLHIGYDSSNPGPDHQYSQNEFTSASGARRLRGSFNIIRHKVSCLVSFFKSLSMLLKLLLVEYPRFGDEGI